MNKLITTLKFIIYFFLSCFIGSLVVGILSIVIIPLVGLSVLVYFERERNTKIIKAGIAKVYDEVYTEILKSTSRSKNKLN